MSERKLAAIMFTDMVGYSALTQRNEALALELLAEHQAFVRPIFVDHGGHVIKSTGDGFLVEFSSALQAVHCAIAAQTAMLRQRDAAPPDRRVQMRIGLHLGDVEVRDGDRFGDGVNIAARVEPLADAGGICITGPVADQVHNKIEYQLERLRRVHLKNIQDPIEVFRLVLPWTPAAPKRHARRPSARSLGLALAGVLVAAALGGWWLTTHRFHTSAPSADERKSIAVLPFVNMSSDKENEYFSDGITEDLITALSKMSGLHVAARTSSFAFKGKNDDIKKIGEQLHVGAVLEGSVAKAGNHVRITAQLIDTANGYHLWSESYDRELADIFAIRTQVAEMVAKALRIQLAAGETQELEEKPTEDVEAYQLYLKGRHAASTYADPVSAMRYLQQAIAQDPKYAMAYNGLAYYYFSGTDGLFAGSECLPRARKAAAKAIELDPELAEPHTWLGAVHWWYDRDYAAARREFQTAISMQPGLASAREVYGWFLVATGETDAGLAESRRAVELDPLSAETNTWLGINLFLTRRYGEAAAQLRIAIDASPDYNYAHLFLGRVYGRMGRYPEAIAELDTAIALRGGVEAEAALGRVYADAGETSKATEVLGHLRAQMGDTFVSGAFLATVYVGLGQNDEAFAALEQAAEQHSYYAAWWKLDPALDPLRSDPRFTALLKKVGLAP